MKITEVLERLMAAGELAQGLRHEPGLQAHVRIAHIAFDLGPGHQGRDRVDDQHVQRAAAHQHLADLKGLLAAVGLGDQQLVGLHAKLAGIGHVQGMLGIDKRG